MIRPAMTVWRNVTERLLTLTQQTAEEQRDETIASIEKCLDDREKLQSHISAPFTAEEEAFGKALVVLEADVQKELDLFRKQIRTDITDSQTKKGTMKSYINPYSDVARDGTFYDTKQ